MNHAITIADLVWIGSIGGGVVVVLLIIVGAIYLLNPWRSGH